MPVNSPNKTYPDILNSWLAVLIFMAVIFYASSIPGNDIPSIIPFQDMLFHCFIYFMLALAFSRALKNSIPDMKVSSMIFLTILFGIFYGITDEFHQTFVSLRTASLADLFTDAIGSVAGSLIFAARKKIIRWPK